MSRITSWPRGQAARPRPLRAVRAATAAGLAAGGCAHLDLAGPYAEAGETISEGVPLRVEAAVALLAAFAEGAACATAPAGAAAAGLAARGRRPRPRPRPPRQRRHRRKGNAAAGGSAA